MTRLRGDFQTDLQPPDALAACAEALDGLGWKIETVEANRIVSFTGPDSTADGARIDVLLRGAEPGTEVRIIGSDTDQNPLDARELVETLNWARDAIRAQVEDSQPTGSHSRFANIPLFRERERSVQIVTALVVPAVFGAVAGIVLGISAGLYWAIQLVALIGAVLAGLEHTSGREGARRGLVGGTIYGIFLLLAHAVTGTDAKVKLPDFEPILVVFTALFGALGSGLGGRLRGSSMPEEGREPAAG